MTKVMFSVCEGSQRYEQFDIFLRDLGWFHSTDVPRDIDYVISSGARSSTLSGTRNSKTHITTTNFDESIMKEFELVALGMRHGKTKDDISYLPGVDAWNRGTVNFYGEEKSLVETVSDVVKKMPGHKVDGDATTDLKTILAHYGKTI